MVALAECGIDAIEGEGAGDEAAGMDGCEDALGLVGLGPVRGTAGAVRETGGDIDAGAAHFALKGPDLGPDLRALGCGEELEGGGDGIGVALGEVGELEEGVVEVGLGEMVELCDARGGECGLAAAGAAPTALCRSAERAL